MEHKEKNFISAVIYVHNASRRIENFLKMIAGTLEEHFEHSEIICVNDASQDDSAQRIREINRNIRCTNITILNMSYYHGLETAMNAGVDLSIGDFVLEFDNVVADFEAEDILRAYNRALQGFDIVTMAPDRQEKLSSRLFYRTFAQFAGADKAMSTESFRILSRRVINRVTSQNKTIPYRKVVYATCGLKMDHLQYSVRPVQGTAKRDGQERRYRWNLAVDSLILFTDVGYHFSIWMTTIMAAIALLMVVYSLFVYFLGSPVEGWTTTVLFLSFGFFGLFGILTIIIKYLQIIVNLVFKRKNFSVESIEKLER